MINKHSFTSLNDFLMNSDIQALNAYITHIHPADILDTIHNEPDINNIKYMLDRLSNRTVAALLDFEEDNDKYKLLNYFNQTRQRAILKEMPNDEIVGLMDTLVEADKTALLSMIIKSDQRAINTILSYKKDSAGSIMTTEFIAIRENKTVLSTYEYLQKIGTKTDMAYYLYIIDKLNHLKVVISIRDLISSPFETKITDIAGYNVISIHVDTDQEKAAQMFEKYDYVMLPVVNSDNVIVGVITVDDIIDIVIDESTEDIHRLAGLDKKEKIDGSLINSIKSRLPWILVNLLTASLAASVILRFSTTIQAIVVLAALNPIITGLGGNAGSQAMTLMVRGIALGQINHKNAMKILIKEFGVGLIIGLIIGVILAVVCTLIYDNIYLGLVAGFSILTSLVIATIVGFSVPLLLNKLKVDPALGSSVLVTAVTDILGFLIFLGLATAFLPYLI